MNILLTGILIITLVQLTFFAYIFWRVRKEINQIKGGFVDFITAPDAQTPSHLAKIVETFSYTAGHAMALEAKTVLLGKLSAISRTEKAIVGDISQDLVAQSNPLVGMALNAFPSLGKRLAKNPAMAEMAIALLSKMSSAPGNNHSNPGPEAGPPKFNL